MLAKKFRFHGHQAVRRAYRNGKSVRNALGSLHVAKNERAKAVKVAVVVSRKVDKSAVVRNRIRRRVYELVRRASGQFPANVELVFTIYQAEAAKIAAPVLKNEVFELLERQKLLK